VSQPSRGEIAFGAMQATLDLSDSPWTRSPAMALPNRSTMARSRSPSPTTTATRLFSRPTNHFLNSLL